MSLAFSDFYPQACDFIEHYLDETLPQPVSGPAPYLNEAMRYAVLGGGKRIRATAAFCVAHTFNQPWQTLAPVAASLECLHAYSLVHDDLPAMDDDKLRRGRPTCHIAYDEATAILAGDSLNAQAFAYLVTPQHGWCAAQHAEMVRTLAQAAGHAGMCGGQAMDCHFTGQAINYNTLNQLHQCKTGALLQAAFELAAIAINLPDDITRQALRTFASHVGLAFQIQDDILDVTGQTQILGKTAGQDTHLNKNTYPGLLGLEGAQEALAASLQQATDALFKIPKDTTLLHDLAQFIVHRQY